MIRRDDAPLKHDVTSDSVSSEFLDDSGLNCVLLRPPVWGRTDPGSPPVSAGPLFWRRSGLPVALINDAAAR